jgi:hypothetical protein
MSPQGETMNVLQLKRVRRLYNVDYISRELNRANQRKWVAAVRMLGDKWLLAQSVERKETV